MVEGAFELAQSALNAMNKVPIDATTNRFLGLIFNAQPDTSGNNVRGENLVRSMIHFICWQDMAHVLYSGIQLYPIH